MLLELLSETAWRQICLSVYISGEWDYGPHPLAACISLWDVVSVFFCVPRFIELLNQHTERCSYNVVSLCCLYNLKCMLSLSYCSDLCDITLYWTVLWRYQTASSNHCHPSTFSLLMLPHNIAATYAYLGIIFARDRSLKSAKRLMKCTYTTAGYFPWIKLLGIKFYIFWLLEIGFPIVFPMD